MRPTERAVVAGVAAPRPPAVERPTAASAVAAPAAPHASMRWDRRWLAANAYWLTAYLVAAVVYALVAWPHTHPPYMDSFYYVDLARGLAQGHGLAERFVWNYLAGLPSLPHSGGTYWLPGYPLLMTPAWLLGGYRACTLLTAALAALCPALAAVIGYDLFASRRRALFMAAVTGFNGLWFHDWTTPDAFVPFAVLATVTLLITYRGLQGRLFGGGAAAFALAGGTAGLAALMRQEGLLLLLAVLAAVALTPAVRRPLGWRAAGAAVGAYLVVQAPWLWQLYATGGSPFASGSTHVLWMRSYSAFYSLFAARLTAADYLRWGGVGPLLGARLSALLFTLVSWLALWQVVLVGPLLVGVWRLRHRVAYRPFLLYWALLALALPLVFTVTLDHGTLQHASAALLPWASAAVAEGVVALGQGLARLRGRDGAALGRGLGAIVATWALLVSLGMTWQTFPRHGDEYTHDRAVVAWLRQHNVSARPVMVLDPPACAYLDEGGRYVVTPSDGPLAARTVAEHYGVAYWVLDALHDPSFDTLYRRRERLSWARVVAVVDGALIYRLIG